MSVVESDHGQVHSMLVQLSEKFVGLLDRGGLFFESFLIFVEELGLLDAHGVVQCGEGSCGEVPSIYMGRSKRQPLRQLQGKGVVPGVPIERMEVEAGLGLKCVLQTTLAISHPHSLYV